MEFGPRGVAERYAFTAQRIGKLTPHEARQAAEARAEAAEGKLLEYENAITWGTSCLSCSRTLDTSIAEHERAERAEGKLAELRAVLLEGGQDDATVRRRALAVIGTEGEGHEH